jgi:biopolymer transport protein ExbB
MSDSIQKHRRFLSAILLLSGAVTSHAQTWWDVAWTVRKPLAINTTAEGASILGPIGTLPVLVRLHDGNFAFDSAQENGADVRFIAADHSSVLPHHIERYDRSLNEALVWVQVPDLKPGENTTIFLYSGNAGQVPAPSESKATFDTNTALVYHFSDASGQPVDASSGGTNATATSLPVVGSLIAGGVRFTGQNEITIPASAPLAWNEGASLTWSAWIKPAAFRPNAIIFSRRDGSAAFLIGENNGIPFAEITTATGTVRTTTGPPLTLETWHHLAVTVDAGTLTLWLDGERHGSAAASLPALAGNSTLGRDQGPAADSTASFNGEVDDLQISNVARPPGWLKFAALSQGGAPEAAKLVTLGSEEANPINVKKPNFFKEHFGIFGDISKSLTVDGWAVIILCFLLALVGAAVAVSKLLYLNRIEKSSKLFMRRWDDLSNDITALDRANEEDLKSLGGSVFGRDLGVVRQSPLFHIYHLGAHEIRKRIDTDGDNFAGLSGRSIEAIKARLDGGLVDEEEKLNSKLVFLTLGIAGGPYLGLLGTVIGVMITFAVIAKSGEVEVNSIAPGIAGALLATVAGLAVAIPALFSYSYLNSRITSALNGIRKFIDEFITRIAEAYPSKD